VASLLSPHGLALQRIAEDPRVRISDIAARLEVTERAAQRIVGYLVDAGLVQRVTDGRHRSYAMAADVRAGILAAGALTRDPAPESRNGQATKRDAIRTKLLAAADQVMVQGETFAEVSVERLIAEAEISRSTFYAHFKDKDALLQALASEILDEMWAAATAWVELPPNATKAEILGTMSEVVAAYRSHGLVMAAASNAGSGSPGVRDQYAALMNRTIERIAEHIAEGQERGYVHPELEPRRTATLLTWGTERGLNKLVAPGTEAEAERLLTALSEIVWNLLYAGLRP
jgi:TetR/AcrR family transcriptional regulator, ethionamide resistance regulator